MQGDILLAIDRFDRGGAMSASWILTTPADNSIDPVFGTESKIVILVM